MVKRQGIGRTVLALSILSALAIFLVSAGLLYHSLYECRKGEREYGELRRYTAEASGWEPDPQSPGSLSAGGQEPMLVVDFEALRKPNLHTIVWTHTPGTLVSYPATRGENNSYCPTRTFPGAYNRTGCIFMDHRGSLPSEGGNMVLYGHNMKDGSMFGFLKRYQDNEYYRKHASFYLYTVEGDNFLCHITDRRRTPVQINLFPNIRDREKEAGENGKADEGGKTSRDAGVTLVTCVAGKNEE